MSETREQLARQSNTLSSINGIVRTMKALSAINAPPYEQAASDIEAYQQSLEKGFAAFAYCTQGRYGKKQGASQERTLHIVFGSDHGLCGNYNEQLASYFAAGFATPNRKPAFAQERKSKSHILCIGARMERALIDHGFQPYKRLMPPASVKGVNRLANQLVHDIQQFSSQQGLQHSHVSLWFTQRAEQSGHVPHHDILLPVPEHLFQAKPHWQSTALPFFTLQEEALLSALIRQYLFVHLYRASAEAIATENAARLALMKQAEQTVADRLAEVKQKASQVRQEEITTELMDIVIGHLDCH